MAIEKRPSMPIQRYVDGTYLMPDRALNGGGSWSLYRVKDKDTWISVSLRDGWHNVWDFIAANLRTRDPAEVNWYLREYIGCQAQDGNKNNYGFSNNAKPGLIWTRSFLTADIPGANLFKTVAAALNFPFHPIFHFQLKGYTLEPYIFARVREYVSKGLIRVRYQAKDTPEQGEGEYVAKKDTLYIRTLSNGFEARALVVHEAVHAGFDYKGNSMIHAYSEAFAYISQCLYYQLTAKRDLGPGDAADSGEAKIFDAANIIAHEIYHAFESRRIYGKSPEKFMVGAKYADPLLNAINSYPRYKGSLHYKTEYDGIPDQYGDL